VIAYVDASVLLRVAFGQTDSLSEWSKIKRGVSSALVTTESLRTLDRLRLRVKVADSDVAERRAKILELIASLELVDIDSVVLDRAAQPMPTELGTLDAIHLATALLWKEMTREDLTMATHDVALAIAAEAHGLPVVGATRNQR
jgi:predicted nucleic acid-binding protein